ncbi:MAG: hypothetical protein Q4E88_03450 [Coriobacteriia bacterium]|nr:hypothetical protein [Coriobacteriia bacterium]
MSNQKKSGIFNVFSILAFLLVAYTAVLNVRVLFDPVSVVMEKITAVIMLISAIFAVHYCIFGYKKNRNVYYHTATNTFGLAAIFITITPFTFVNVKIDPVITPLFIGLSCMVFGFIVALALGRSPKKNSYVLCVLIIIFYLALHTVCAVGLFTPFEFPYESMSLFSSSAAMLAISIVVFAMTIARFKRLERE